MTCFFENGCGCTLFDGKPCYTAFTREHICSIRDQSSSFDRHDRYNVLFGHVMATVKASDTVGTRGHPTKNRLRNSGEFLHEGMKVKIFISKRSYLCFQICRTTYFFLNTIGRKVYQRAKDQYLTNGLPPISHGNAKRLPSHGFATVDIRQVTTFLTNYSQANAILLPGRVAMHKRSDVQLLPTHTTKNSV